MQESYLYKRGSLKTEKPILYVDMDGVLVDFEKKAKAIGHIAGDPKPLDLFKGLEPYPDAIWAWNILQEKFDTYILSTAPWSVPDSFTDKRLWVEKYLGESGYKKLILTSNKGLLKGEFLIDDRKANGVLDFEGEHIFFGHDPFVDWKSVVSYLLSK
jgi:5'(3')-deoxyribonucleotidase